MKPIPLDILKTYWGYDQFKPSQELAVNSILIQKDTCVFLPTGGGKSICFQVPALVEPGICIVISPLVALMQDQVENLKSRGIKAQLLKSGMSHVEVDQRLDNCIYGNYKFLYLSPERLQQELVRERIRKMNVNFIAVDEAHCISQWGHDFRPAYREIHLLKELQPGISIIALTATATEKVKQDIITELELEDPAIISESFRRPNIVLLTDFTADKMNALYSQLNIATENSIVYVRNRSACVELSEFLNKKGLRSTYFHGGISQTDKQKKLANWLKEDYPIMIATNAFGMGIDKANVRQVIHYHLPESLESYYQEAGRAGRDGKPSKAIVLFNESDKQRLKNQFIKTIPSFEAIKNVYKALMSNFRIAYGEGENEVFDFNFYEFCTHYKLHTILTYNTLNLLDRLSVISLDKSFQKKAKLKFLVTSKAVINFIDSHTRFALLIRTILRTYGGVFDNELTLNMQLIKKKTGYNNKEVYDQLEALKKHGILSAEFIKQDLSITFILPREDKYTLNPLRKYVNDYQNNKLQKAETVLLYIEEKTLCLQGFILNYFGEKELKPCGKCSVCLASQTKINPQLSSKYQDLNGCILEELKLSNLSSKELSLKIKYPKEALLKSLQQLLESEKITLESNNTYSLNL
ncbi:RecQ family ATP-dependent DNA helicase [Psychroflexus sp. MES1-P1E]|uniref:RecQ family ATP-dependent DNA helicase n=1 Tax=Psychroflexus sp. MES1-P1E TaxID=2058320 RepID=UPI000C7C9FA1|nr:RecQ family ATP-dependent DNA helicase [Psychroflexus sp. MES1-P1E]PKG43163.1 RecQ family ATP-dependent DNA helicase [Psychroflexus sp. MES1-P1E]